MKKIQKFILLIMSAVICITSYMGICPSIVHADRGDLVYLNFSIDDGAVFKVPAYETKTVNNYYVSLRELSRALSGSVLQYSFYNDENGMFHIDTGYAYDASSEPEVRDENDELIQYEREEMAYLAQAAYNTMINDLEVVYYTYVDWNLEDLYMSLLDLQLIFDIKIEYSDSDDVYRFCSADKFSIDLNELAAGGYFDYLHGVLLGDATSGEILFASEADQPVPIASTTKLMTYLIVMRMIELGKFSMDDYASISARVTRQSQSDDAVFCMFEGEQISVRELIYAMMVQSSNESALALAEYAAGSEEAFVELMNKMAFVLGLESAKFYNPHGLPTYFKGSVTTMVENQMSAEDMFTLACAILTKYPQVTEISSLQNVWLEDFWTTAVTTNSLLYNMEDLVGLKTGTTDAAGKCLVSARKVNVDGEEHILVGIVFGAEENKDRVQMSQLLLMSQGY